MSYHREIYKQFYNQDILNFISTCENINIKGILKILQNKTFDNIDKDTLMYIYKHYEMTTHEKIQILEYIVFQKVFSI